MNASLSSWGSRRNLKAFDMRCQQNEKNCETLQKNISIFYLQNFTFCFLKREGNYLPETACLPARCGSRTSLSNSDCAQQLWKGFRVRVWFLWRSKYNYQRQKTEIWSVSNLEENRRRRRDRKVKVRVAPSRRRRRRSFMTAIKSAIF